MNHLARLAVVALCAELLASAQRPPIEYSIWAGKPSNVMNGPPDATYIVDSTSRVRSISSDEWILARHSPMHIRLRSKPGRWWYSLGGKFRRSECVAGPYRWIISPSGAVIACVNDYYPDTTLHVWRSSDLRPVATIKLPNAYVEGRDQIAFVDDERVLFSVLDSSCPRGPMSNGMRSIAAISLRAPRASGIMQRCASEVLVGARHVAYLREEGTEYSIDGGQWVRQMMYAFDQSDNPITDESPLISSFKAQHPDLAIWLVSVGLAPSKREMTDQRIY